MDTSSSGDNPFANFQSTPTYFGRFNSFVRKNKSRQMASLSASRESLTIGSHTSPVTFGLTGSQQNLLDVNKRYSMQEDARSRKISAEVMKHKLYESVISSPRRRRYSSRMDTSFHDSHVDSGSCRDVPNYRFVQSMPVTPAHSRNTTPLHSPKSARKFMFGFFSNVQSPDREGSVCMRHNEEEEMELGDDGLEPGGGSGIASIFHPQPRCITMTRPGDAATAAPFTDSVMDSLFKRPVAPPPRYKKITPEH